MMQAISSAPKTVSVSDEELLSEMKGGRGPILAAIGIVTTSDVGWPGNAAILAAYCVVMVAPALLLLLGRLVAARAVDPVLHRLDRWLTRNATDMTGWVLGALGVLLALNAFGRLGWA